MIGAGLFLDLDGTLADSLGVIRTVYDRFLERFGKIGGDAEFDSLNGPPMAEVVACLIRNHAINQQVDDAIEIYRGLIAETYSDVAPFAGAEELLRLARSRAMPVGVVTSNNAALTRKWLRTVGLDALVDDVVGGDDVTRGKPDPEPYLTMLERTGCKASASLAVEDSVMGAGAAIAAGIPTLFVAGEKADAPVGIAGLVGGLYAVADYLRVST
ncbi:MAG: HAD-IA family hydrolase [Rhodospirillales bacterium]|jgi:HAD superfamily hydrolase (TIGR01509 family)|nr:HAD-IA family hydrolase [Rhodospirillales bacterium]